MNRAGNTITVQPASPYALPPRRGRARRSRSRCRSRGRTAGQGHAAAGLHPADQRRQQVVAADQQQEGAHRRVPTGEQAEPAAEPALPASKASTTKMEWPSEKNRPTPTGRCSPCIRRRVTLSMAAMWSASMARRRPKPRAIGADSSSAGEPERQQRPASGQQVQAVGLPGSVEKAGARKGGKAWTIKRRGRSRHGSEPAGGGAVRQAAPPPRARLRRRLRGTPRAGCHRLIGSGKPPWTVATSSGPSPRRVCRPRRGSPLPTPCRNPAASPPRSASIRI